jgi:hypothetical protein
MTDDIHARVAKAAAEQQRRQGAGKRKERVEQRVQRAGYKLSEFSAALGIDDATAFRWINKGVVRAVLIGGLTIIPAAEMDRLLSEGSPGRKDRERAEGGKFAKAWA